MTFVITQRCCNDASCIAECPVDCIRPRPSDPDYARSEMLYIDPDTCIDCGACVVACPVDAIFADSALPAQYEPFIDIATDYFARHPLQPDTSIPIPRPAPSKELGRLRVAIVGAGPAALYAAEHVQSRVFDAEIEVFDRLPTPYGLVRAGVAPDHPETRGAATVFEKILRRSTFAYHLNVEVGKHLTHEELLAHHHGVIYAVGAMSDRHLDIAGEELSGSHSATEFVAWYNGHPDYSDRTFDLSGERVVIVGNGNVALDVARILTAPISELEKSDIADYALAALRDSKVREVIVLGRRGPVQAAYTCPEFLALKYLPGVDVVIDPADVAIDAASQAQLDDPQAEPTLALKQQLAQDFAATTGSAGNRRIVFRYRVSPTELVQRAGTNAVGAVRVTGNELVLDDRGAVVARPTGETGEIATSMVLRSVGYRGSAIAGVPFDEVRAVVPNVAGRVIDEAGEPVPGVFVTGWIKRGPRGVIGTNKQDSVETVESLVADFEAGRLAAPSHDRDDLNQLIAKRQPDAIDRNGWRRIDMKESEAGKEQGRPRVKLTSVFELLEASKS